MLLVSWQTLYMWKYHSNSNSYSSGKFQSFPEIWCQWEYDVSGKTYMAFRRKGILISALSVCQYVSISVGIHVFSKTAHRIFLKLLMKLGCLKVKTRSSWIFGENVRFGDNVQKHPHNRIFTICKKKKKIVH